MCLVWVSLEGTFQEYLQKSTEILCSENVFAYSVLDWVSEGQQKQSSLPCSSKFQTHLGKRHSCIYIPVLLANGFYSFKSRFYLRFRASPNPAQKSQWCRYGGHMLLMSAARGAGSA